MDPHQADEYDVVIVGTSLVQSILAAALARSGRKVLNVDDDMLYGAQNATLSLAEFERFLQGEEDAGKAQPIESDQVSKGAVLSRTSGSSLSAFKPLGVAEGSRPAARVNDFNFDLTPRLVFCRGQCVDVLAESGVSRYLEFQTMDGTFYCPSSNDNGGAIDTLLVPQSKSQVFASGTLSMVEKRQLMRFLQFCLDYRSASNSVAAGEEGVEWTNERLGAQNPGRSLTRPQNKSEDSELRDKAITSKGDPLSLFLQRDVRMSKKLTDIVLFAIAHQAYGTGRELTVEDGMTRVGRYLGALGRFGSTPFLTPMYGSGEICQGFSRLCAVYGGICALGIKPLAIREDGIAFTSVARQSLGDVQFPPFVKAKAAMVVSGSYFNESDALFPGYLDEVEVRAIALLSGSVFDQGFHRTFFVIPTMLSGFSAAHGIQLDHKARVVADQQYVLHLTIRVKTSTAETIHAAKMHLATILDQLVAKKKGEVQITWKSYFWRRLVIDRPQPIQVKEGLSLFISGDASSKVSVGLDVDLDDAFARAEHMFKAICPGETFLPPSESELRARQEEQSAAIMAMPDMEA